MHFNSSPLCSFQHTHQHLSDMEAKTKGAVLALQLLSHTHRHMLATEAQKRSGPSRNTGKTPASLPLELIIRPRQDMSEVEARSMEKMGTLTVHFGSSSLSSFQSTQVPLHVGSEAFRLLSICRSSRYILRMSLWSLQVTNMTIETVLNLTKMGTK